MEIKDAILYLINNWVSTILAIIVVAGVVVKIRPVGKALKHLAFRELYAADEKHDKRLDQLEMQQLKQIICNSSLPIEDRLDAGDEYIGRGGNGAVKARYESLKCAFIRMKQEKS
jgi:hypothetical protein